MLISFADLATLYSENKDVACALAGFAYPGGRLLIWSGSKTIAAGCWLTNWAFTARPTPPLDDTVAVLLENIAKMDICHRHNSGDVNLSADETVVIFNGKVQYKGVDVPYEPHETQAILAAAKARAAKLKAAERDRLRVAAAVGN